jgi:cytochrome b pre-mRNA-processing protein 3
MNLARLGARRPAKSAGRALYEGAVKQARTPALYAVMGAPDTVEGRFELLTLHVILLVDRLRQAGEEAQASRQALFDAYVSDLDGALREMGVGDLVVGKRMKALGKAFYGRAASYRDAFAALPDRGLLEDLIARTILEGAASPRPDLLADYVLASRERLAGQCVAGLLSGESPWPAS